MINHASGRFLEGRERGEHLLPIRSSVSQATHSEAEELKEYEREL